MNLNLDTIGALTTATPTAAELRIRVVFWRKFAAGIECINDQTTSAYEMVIANCSDMAAAADAMTVDGPVPAATPAPAPAKAAVSKVRKATGITAEVFWQRHGAAVQAIRAECGERWYLTGETVTGSIPAKLRSMIGPLGGKITWRRDHRFPAARYWPDGAIPAEVALAPVWVPSADFHAPEREIERITREAREEQIKTDHALNLDKRVDAALASYWLKLSDLNSLAVRGAVRTAYIDSVNLAADYVISLFPVIDDAETIEQESRDDRDEERVAEIIADEISEQELARAVRNAEYEDNRAAEQKIWNKLELEARDADRVMLEHRDYVAWWNDAVDNADINTMIEEQRQAEWQAAEMAKAKHALQKAASWEAAQAKRATRAVKPTTSHTNAFNAGRAAFLASMELPAV